jgi:hypothetical protein
VRAGAEDIIGEPRGLERFPINVHSRLGGRRRGIAGV